MATIAAARWSEARTTLMQHRQAQVRTPYYSWVSPVCLTFKWIFDVKEDDTFWCTADIGWVTGHSYIVYGPLAFGATSVMFEGVPPSPRPDKFWEIVERRKINILYTASTALRALMREGDECLTNMT